MSRSIVWRSRWTGYPPRRSSYATISSSNSPNRNVEYELGCDIGLDAIPVATMLSAASEKLQINFRRSLWSITAGQCHHAISGRRSDGIHQRYSNKKERPV